MKSQQHTFCVAPSVFLCRTIDAKCFCSTCRELSIVVFRPTLVNIDNEKIYLNRYWIMSTRRTDGENFAKKRDGGPDAKTMRTRRAVSRIKTTYIRLILSTVAPVDWDVRKKTHSKTRRCKLKTHNNWQRRRSGNWVFCNHFRMQQQKRKTTKRCSLQSCAIKWTLRMRPKTNKKFSLYSIMNGRDPNSLAQIMTTSLTLSQKLANKLRYSYE